MPTWGEILKEMTDAAGANNGVIDIDSIRRNYLTRLATLTGRSTILYAADYLHPLKASSPQLMITPGDMQGFMETVNGLPGPELDLILHSPGGQAEATELLVRYLRSKYTYIRVIIPFAAMSAATMWAMAADEIVMGAHSQVGPIDPQFRLPSGVVVPAGALLEQFQTVLDECSADPSKVTAWVPTLQQYPPGLLNMCKASDSLAKQLVSQWLAKYLLKSLEDSESKAMEIATWLADNSTHLSHSRVITRDDLAARGIPITHLEADSALQDAVLSVHHATMHTFANPNVIKLVENSNGRAWVQPMIVAG